MDDIQLGVYLVDKQKFWVAETVRKDMSETYGDRISLEQLTGILWFNMDSAFKRMAEEGFPLILRQDPKTGERYVCRDELTEWLIAQYCEATGHNDLND